MKKYLLFCLVCCLSVAFLTSCEKEDINEMGFTETSTSDARFSDTLVTDYPTAIDEYITQNFPGATVDEVELEEDGTYGVELDNGIELIFDANGNFLEEEMEDEEGEDEDNYVTDYPAAIDEYVAQNYPDASIEEVELEDDGTYEVELDNDVELIFDADGNFLEEEMEDEEGEDEDNYVTDYPAAIDEYVAQNYPDATIEEVELEDDGTYEVELDNDIELIFDADGNFLEEGD